MGGLGTIECKDRKLSTWPLVHPSNLMTVTHFGPFWPQIHPWMVSTWPNSVNLAQFGPMPPLNSANFAKFGPIPPSDSGNLARIVPTLPKLAQFHPWILTTLPNYTIEFVIEFVFKLSDSNFTSDPLNYQVHFTFRSTSLCACICTGAH